MPLRLSKYQNGKSITSVYASQKLQPFNSLRMLCQTFMRASYHKSCLWIILLTALPCAAQVPFTNLTANGSVAATTSYTTASVTPIANQPVFLATSAHLGTGNGPLPVSSVSGGGLAWSLVSGLDAGLTTGTARTNRLEIWCGVGSSPSAGALTITWTTSPTATSWSVDQSVGTARTCASVVGTPASNPANAATASPLTVAVSFRNAANATYAAGFTDATETITSGLGFTLLGLNNSNSNSLATEYAAGNVSPATFGYPTSTVRWGIIAVEVNAAVGGRKPLVIQ